MNGLAERAVDVDLAEAEGVNRLHHGAVVAAEDVGGKAVAGVVGDLDGLLERVDTEDRRHRPEGLLVHHRHLRRDVSQHRRREPITAGVGIAIRARAACQDRGALAASRVDGRHGLRELGRVDERPHIDAAGVGVADAQSLHGADVALRELLDDVVVDEHALGARADLAAVEVAGRDERGHSDVEVRVAPDDRRRLAAELECYPREIGGGRSHDPLAGVAVSRERDQ